VQRAQQLIDGGQGVRFGDLRQVGIARGRGGAGMTEKILDVTQAQAALKQMGGKTVTQGVG
jgi:hypothetical protein